MARKRRPIHPGEILAAEFLAPLEVSQYRLAQDISVPPRRINEIVHGKRSISADTALRLARYFGTSEEFWLNLQARFDLEVQRDELGPRLKKDVRVLQRASLRGVEPDRRAAAAALSDSLASGNLFDPPAG